MWDTIAFADSPLNVSVKLNVPSAFGVALNEPVAVLAVGGVSLIPAKFAVSLTILSSAEAATARVMKQTTQSASNQSFFIGVSFSL